MVDGRVSVLVCASSLALLQWKSQMYTRKLISLFYPPIAQQTEPLANVGTSPDAEFDWPPHAEDMDAFTVVHLRAEDGSELAPVADVA